VPPKRCGREHAQALSDGHLGILQGNGYAAYKSLVELGVSYPS
jgi:hypothetical protein